MFKHLINNAFRTGRTTPRRYFSESSSTDPSFVMMLQGKPGGGKGTVSKWLVKDYGFLHLSAGDILRHEVAEKTAYGSKVQEHLAQGNLVPDDLVSKIVVSRLHELAHVENPRIILDGFPRTINQAHMLEDAEKEDRFSLGLVAALEVPSNEIISRLSDRWVHEPSGRVYSYSFNPPKGEGLDDETGEPLIRRSDDEPETIAKRLTVYDQKTFPLIEYYEKKGVLQSFDGSDFPELLEKNERSKAIYKQLCSRLNAIL